jgi:cytochrome c-type biogenesis protein CcmE
MLHRRFVYLGIGGVILLVVALTLSGLNDNLTYYLYPTEAVAQRADFPDGESFRLAGTVVGGTLSENDDSINFEISDGGATIPVLLTESAPSLFGEGIPVLLEGSWDGERFVADDVLIRHSENYETPEEGGAYPSG